MKTKFKAALHAVGLSFGGLVCVGVALLIASSAPAQNLFVSDGGSGTIFEFTPLGAQLTFASGLSSPYGLAFDSAGNLFVADAGSGNIYKFTPGGVQSTFASGLGFPQGLAIDSADNLFVADAGSGNIYEYTPGGAQTTFATGLTFPFGLAFDNAGNLFEADAGSGNIYQFTPGGAQTNFFSGLNSPQGLAFNSAGDLFEADNGSGTIYEYTPGGVQSAFTNGLSGPTGLAFNSAGDLFEADNGSLTVYEFPPGGGSPSTIATNLSPTFLAVRGAAHTTGTVLSAGIYGGQVNDITFNDPNAGVFAVFVGTNGHATVVGYDVDSAAIETNSQAGGVAAQFNVNTNGSWQFSSNNTMFGVSGFGTIGSDGSFSGELDFTNGDSVLLNGSQQSPLGNFQNEAGYYAGSYTGAFTGPLIGVLSASGQMVVSVFGNGALNDGSQGQFNSSNQFTTTSATGTIISGTLTNSTLKIGGSAIPTGGGNVTFTISRSAYVLQVATTNLPDGTTTVPYSQTLVAVGGPTNYSWGIISGGLPAGLSLSGSGVISGTPATPATTNFTVQVTNAVGVTVAQSLTLTIDALDNNVTFIVTPSAVSNTYTGTITLQVTGLKTGEKVTVQKYLDDNNNGVIDAADLLAQQFNLTDGKTIVIDGVTNFNVPGDGNATTGAITATLNFKNGDFMQNVMGQYAFKLSSPTAHFAPITNLFNVTNFPYSQKITGNVFSNGTATAVSGAVVILFPPPRVGKSSDLGNPVALAVANNAGVYSIMAPPGSYVPLAFSRNYVGNFQASPLVALNSGATTNVNLTLTNATSSISGQLVDANDSSKGLPGVFFSAKSTNGLIASAFTDTNGNFNVQVTAGKWELKADDTALIVHGYLGLQNKTNATAGAAGVTLAVPQATALIYGSVMDNQGNPLVDLDVYAFDNQNNLYETDGYTDQNGNYVCGVLGLGASDSWQVQANGNNQLNNYVFSQPSFPGQNGGTNISAGQAVLVNFTAIPTTNQISGHVQDNFGNSIVGVQLDTFSATNGVTYTANSATTDTNGNYSFNVPNGIWTVNINTGGGSGSLSTNYIAPPSENVTVLNTNVVLNFTVQTNSGGALTVTTTNLPNGTIGLAYSQELAANGGQPPYSWTTNSGLLPPGLSLDANGFISGIPTANGIFNFTVQVTDQISSNATKALSLTISADTQPPVVAITDITAGMLVSNAAFTVMGTATDNVAVASVFFSLNGSAFALAVTANNWANWSTNVALIPGTNTVRAYAVDTSNNNSTTNTVKLVYVLSAPLTVQTNGNGSINPNDNGVLLQIGTTYSLTATAGAGFAFTNWTGGTNGTSVVLTNGAVVTFMMQSNLVLQANFVETNTPTVSITNIISGMSVSNAAFTVRGTAGDIVAVTNVYYSLNGSAFTNAVTGNGWTNWSAAVTLVPGTNTISAYSVNIVGIPSATNTVTLVYVLSAPLTVQTNGNGSINPNDNGVLLQIGANYLLTASAGTGFAFTNWTGGTNGTLVVLTNGPALRFVMQSNLVLQANFVETNTPTVSITNITAGLSVSNAAFTVLGTAGDVVAVTNVSYSLNGAPFTNAVTGNGWTNWSAVVTLVPGTNTISAYAVNIVGIPSLTNTVKLVYVVSAPLTLQTNGNGSINPNDNGVLLQIGANYLLTATAGAGFAFTNWTGGTNGTLVVLTNGPALRFVMQSNLVLQANFVETNTPTVSITNIISGMSVSNAAFTVLGTAGDVVAMTNVSYSLNGLAFTNAVTGNGWTNWSAAVTLVPGTNTISAYSVNIVGIVSATNTVKLIYVLSAPLTVQTNGNGSINPNDNGVLLQIGANYLLTATAGAGFAFTNWTGGTNGTLVVLTNGPALRFVMQSNLVLQANFVETNTPTVSITNITAGLSVSNAAFTVRGTAGDVVAVTNVYYSLNGSAFTNAVTGNGWTNWSAAVTLVPGTNTISAYSVNIVGIPSATNTVTLVYVLSAPLTVQTNGNGSINPNDNGVLLQIGANYLLTASAGTGFAFTNWTGGTNGTLVVLTNGPALRFVMQSNLVLQANFVETNTPTVSITNITAGLSVSNAAFTVLGTAGDVVAVTNVSYSLNGAPFTNAVTGNGWTNWSAVVTLVPGTNTISAYAVNIVGIPSLTNTVKLVYVVSAPLTLQTNGNGSINPNDNGVLLQIGANYLLTATAGAGFAFTNWTGGTNGTLVVLTNGPALRFVMQSNLVLQANFVETNTPTVSITNITAGLSVSNAAFTVLGTAGDVVAVTNVSYSLNGAPFTNAVTGNGWTNWSAAVTLVPGTNTISAYSVNIVGIVSATNTVKLIYVLSAPLTVQTNGNGSINPNDNGVLLQIGASYSLTATAGTGFAFTNWTGGTNGTLVVLTNGPVLQFVMQSNLVLQANFVETNTPTVSITNITAGLSVSNAAFTVLGTAGDVVAVTNVSYSLNGAPFTNAVTGNGWTNWSAVVTLVPGTNTISAYAVNIVGIPSLTNTVKLVYVVSAPLTLQTNGVGTISPNYNGVLLQIGAAYSLTATTNAGAGFAFTNWTGGTNGTLVVLTNGPVLQFVMQSNLVLQANFVDVQPPVVAITNITAGMLVSNAAFTVMGTATDNVAVAGVYVSLSNAVVNTGFALATTTNNWATWSTNVTLTVGTNTVRAYAVDTSGNISPTTSVSLVLTFQIVTASLPVGTNGFPYSQALIVSGGQPPYTWTNVAGTLPAGLSLSTNGIISGTPTVSATNNLTLQVTDNTGSTTNRVFTLVIVNPPPLQITTTSLPNGTNGVAYSQTLGVTGGHPPYTWTLNAGTPPPGLNLSTNGVISGMPTASGPSSFTVRVTDAGSATKIKPLTLVIYTNAATVRPILNSAGYFSGSLFRIQLNGVAGQNYTLQTSTNLGSTNWLTIFITNAPGGTLTITDPNATNVGAFYRILVGP